MSERIWAKNMQREEGSKGIPDKQSRKLTAKEEAVVADKEAQKLRQCFLSSKPQIIEDLH